MMPPTHSSQTKFLPSATHLSYLDGLRALAAMYVVCHHAVSTRTANEHLTGGAKALAMVFAHGHSAVNLFIVLSGFCLMLPVVRGNGNLHGGAVNFFKKRARRILPPYFCALGVSLIFIFFLIGNKTGTTWDISIPVTTAGLVTHLLLVQDAFVSTRCNIDHPLWSISVEWRIYLIFPLLILSWKRFGALVTTGIGFVSSLILLVALSYTPLNLKTPGVSPQYLALFVFGMLASGISYSADDVLSRMRRRIPWMMLSFVLFLIVALVSRSEAISTAYVDFIVGLWAMTVLVSASETENNWLNRMLSWKPLVFIGTFAYSIYLIHAPLLQIIWQYALEPFHLSPNMTLFALYFVGGPLILGISYGFFFIFERPFLNSKRRETLAETATEAALSPAP